jgi:hypothetical protein
MFRPVGFALVTSLAAVAFTQSSTPQPASAPVQIVYTLDGSTLTTYNINAQTLQPAQAGAITVSQATSPGVAPSPDGHFLYYTSYTDYSYDGGQLAVYATNADGAPQSTPVQTLNFPSMYGPLADPAAPYVYAVSFDNTGTNTSPYSIVRYKRDTQTGELSDPVTEATYDLSTQQEGYYCSLGILGFSPDGGELYDDVYCTAPFGNSSATYYESSVNSANGKLGKDQQIYNWSNPNAGGETVQFVRNLMFDYASPNPSVGAPEYIDVYPVQPNTNTPLIQCTSSMQAVCGSYQLALAHPSGRYVFLFDQENITEIDQVNLSAGQFTPTSSSIPYEVQQFSPDGSIAYGVNDTSSGALEIEIYGFNAADAATTTGGTIPVPSDLDSWWTAERF